MGLRRWRLLVVIAPGIPLHTDGTRVYDHGQSAGTVAAIAIDENTTVQNISYDKLKEALLKGKQLLVEDQFTEI